MALPNLNSKLVRENVKKIKIRKCKLKRGEYVRFDSLLRDTKDEKNFKSFY